MYINRVIRFLDHCEWSNALAHIPQTRKFLAPERQVDLDAMEVTCRMASGHRESTSRLTAVLKEFDLLKRWQWDQVTVSSLAVAAITCGDDNAFDRMFKKMKDAKIDTAGMLKEALVIAHEFIDAERTQDASNSLRVLKRVPATALPRMQPGFDELRFLLSPMSNNDIPNALKIAEERLTVNPKRTECLATRVLAATTDSDLRCKAFGLLGQAIAQRSDSRPTDIDRVEEALRYCQRNDNRDSNVQLLPSLAKVKEKRSDYAAMERYVIQARELSKRTSARSQIDCTILLARCFSLQNKFAATMATEDELHKLIAANNRSYLTKTMVDIVEVNHKYALRLLPKEALSLYQQNLRFTSVARLGIYLEEAGRKTEALACFGFVFEKCGPLSEQENYIRNFAWQYLELLYKAGREEDRVRFEQTLANHRESAQTYLRMAEERLTEADAAATYRFLDVCQIGEKIHSEIRVGQLPPHPCASPNFRASPS